MHIIAAKAVAFGEALQPEFKQYIQNVVNNAKALSDSLTKRGAKIVSGGTDNHLFLLDVDKSFGLTGKVAEKLLDEVGITTNKNTIPFETKSPFVTSGIRIGTPAVTTRGLIEEDMETLAEIIYNVLSNPENEEVKEKAKKKVEIICNAYPIYN